MGLSLPVSTGKLDKIFPVLGLKPELLRKASIILNSMLKDIGIPKIIGKESSGKGIYFLGFKNHLGGFLRNISIEAISIGEEILRNNKN